MKKFLQVLKELKKNPIIIGFDSVDDVFNQFAQPKDGEKILFAFYDRGGWDGSATVLFFKGGKYYEVYGSHCSCYGLENQWKPEEIVNKEFENRILNGYFTGKEILQAKLAE